MKALRKVLVAMLSLLGVPLVAYAQPASASLANSSYLTTANTAAINPQQFTIEARIRPDGPGYGNSSDGANFVAKPRQDGATGGTFLWSWYLAWSPTTGKIIVGVTHVFNSSGTIFASNATIAIGQTAAVAATFDGTRLRLYIDGVLDSSAPAPSSVVYYGANEPVLIGAGNYGLGFTRRFQGLIDDVRIWDRARIGAEIAAGSDCGFAGPRTGLLAEWNFDNNLTTDVSGNSRDATWVGAAAVGPNICGLSIVRSILVPATTNLAGKIDLGFIPANTQVRVSAVGSVELYAPNYYQTFADGSLALPLNAGIVTWTAENGPYPTFAGGDGINRYPGGGTNWSSTQWPELGAQSTDTQNPGTIRFGTLVGTFNPSPTAADWFVLGRDTIVTTPPTGARLYAAVNDCAGCGPDNRGSYIVTVGGRVHSLRDDFNAMNNPSGPWSYGFRLTTEVPGTFTRFATRFFPYIVSVGGWNGSSQFGQTLPTTNKNFSTVSTVSDGSTAWLPNELTAHPGAGRDFVSRFIAPVSGLYTLSGSFRGMSVSGTNSSILIHLGTALLFQANVVGYQTIVNMPAQQVFLTAGDVIDLAVTGGTDFNTDSTGLDLRIEELCTRISREPESISECPAAAATFSVIAAGTGPLTYQWQWQPAGPGTAWAALADGINANDQATPTFNVSGATTPTMNISSISGVGGNLRSIVTSACGSVTSNQATFTINTCGPVACSIADIVGGDGNPPADSSVDGNDFQAFLNAFGGGDNLADIVGGDGNPPADASVDGNDFQAFLNSFAAGC